MDYIHELRKEIGPRKIILNCAGALIIKDDKILFQRRTDNGKWGLIGGLVEMNETYTQAALREIREETGLEVRLDSFLGIFHNHNMVWSNGDAAHVISAMFTASIVSGEPRIDEESYELRFSERMKFRNSSLRIILLRWMLISAGSVCHCCRKTSISPWRHTEIGI